MTPAVPEGFLDAVGPVVAGWAWLPSDPGRRLRVEILFGGSSMREAMRVETRIEAPADRHRPDLEAAGKGDGRCGFVVPVPDALAGREHAVDVRLPDFPEARLRGAPRLAIAALGLVTLRALRPTDADLARLRAFLADMARLNGGIPATAVPEAADVRAWVAGGLPGELAGDDRCWLVAERGDRIVGHCRIGPDWPAPPGSGALALGIELHPDVRGFGLGRSLMLAAHRWAAGRCARLELAVLPHNAGALALYRALGYADLGPVALPETGEIHRRMALGLPARGRPEGTGVVTLVV
ncbi:GNAT family N-acetyltransferase [Azospirillum rugosum]|uniref:GNAT superfamily N-acetyltransferase n=1 Tax=Azospirillum rugosum TaxID=416170 RepID=A0ABS4SPW0_9PROT|nr:GNAT family N-acetyltransferase [Azospirillum rugosum]MBP2294274.1 GNAT superfamily N-acetyltransferase [Azospirillum rugosum]MDQ0527609.1 GNAT superfamily N-acetyltransferase [Azospirillum rugosum]